jgi:hypothetical protein
VFCETAHTNMRQSRQRHCCPIEVGRDRVQGQTRLRRPVHEHPALKYRRVCRRRQFRYARPGSHTVQQRSLDRQGRRGGTKSVKGHSDEWMSKAEHEQATRQYEESVRKRRALTARTTGTCLRTGSRWRREPQTHLWRSNRTDTKSLTRRDFVVGTPRRA